MEGYESGSAQINKGSARTKSNRFYGSGIRKLEEYSGELDAYCRNSKKVNNGLFHTWNLAIISLHSSANSVISGLIKNISLWLKNYLEHKLSNLAKFSVALSKELLWILKLSQRWYESWLTVTRYKAKEKHHIRVSWQLFS
jgi:hypothetical protein